jgi:hypothetical protein
MFALAELEVDLEITLVRIVAEPGLQPGRLEEGVPRCVVLHYSRRGMRAKATDRSEEISELDGSGEQVLSSRHTRLREVVGSGPRS